MKNIVCDDLQCDGLELFQDRSGYNFSSDSVILANVIKTKATDVCIDVGSGSGIVSVLVAHKTSAKKIYAVELQKQSAILLEKNILHNKMQDKIFAYNQSFVGFYKNLEKQVDVVFCNPPYFRLDRTASTNERVATARHEKFLPMEDLLENVGKCLKFGGSFYCLYPTDRLCEFICKAQKYNLMPKVIQNVYPKEHKESNVFVAKCVKGGKFGVKVLKPIYADCKDILEGLERF